MQNQTVHVHAGCMIQHIDVRVISRTVGNASKELWLRLFARYSRKPMALALNWWARFSLRRDWTDLSKSAGRRIAIGWFKKYSFLRMTKIRSACSFSFPFLSSFWGVA